MSVWPLTCRLLARYLSAGTRLDHLLEDLPAQLPAVDRRRCRHLLYGSVRHFALLNSAIDAHVARRPRPALRAILMMAAFELREDPEAAPVVVHHAVEVARKVTSAGEAKLVNAVLRRIPETLRDLEEGGDDSAKSLGLRYSHPSWMVARWLKAFGEEATRALLEWNQQPAPTHARLVTPPESLTEPLPEFFVSTAWPGFFRLEKPAWDVIEQWLAAGRIYLQDPATSFAPNLLGATAGETVLDLCAAPGGKTLQLAAGVGPDGRVIAADLGGLRQKRLRENVARYPDLAVTVAKVDLRQPLVDQLISQDLPADYAAVLIDVPCSNTGVLRHRVDAKWRLAVKDISGIARTQASMLADAASVVRPGGRLVYSTCSLEAEENTDLVEAFVAASHGAFVLEETRQSQPWESGCDGAGAFRLRRAG